MLRAKEAADDQDKAATKLQGIARQREAKRQVGDLRAKHAMEQINIDFTLLGAFGESPEGDDASSEEGEVKGSTQDQDKAATKLQGIARQKEAKQQVVVLRVKKTADDEDKAATKLQGIARQREAKK